MFQPTEGGYLTVDLGGETMRLPVVFVPSPDSAVVVLESSPMSRNHPYRMGDEVLARRGHGELGEIWTADTRQRVVRREVEDAAPVALKKGGRRS